MVFKREFHFVRQKPCKVGSKHEQELITVLSTMINLKEIRSVLQKECSK
jgi:hypothetical protein